MTSLAGRTVVVTRAAEQAGTLATRLADLGATVLEVPTVAVCDPDDGGAALREAATRLATYDWVVLTSPNGAARLAAALGGGSGSALPWPAGGPSVAVVGPGTADAARHLGLPVDLVPERFVAEGLVAAFPPGSGRVLLAQADQARPVAADGLGAKGWDVDVVVAYRTVPAAIGPDVAGRLNSADAVTFTSGSTVRYLVEAIGPTAVPSVVVCIGPVTAAAAEAAGLHVTAVAERHDLDGLVDAVVEVLR